MKIILKHKKTTAVMLYTLKVGDSFVFDEEYYTLVAEHSALTTYEAQIGACISVCAFSFNTNRIFFFGHKTLVTPIKAEVYIHNEN